MSADITGPQLSLLCKTLGLGMSSTRPTYNWLPEADAKDNFDDLMILMDKNLMEVGKGTPTFYKATPAGQSLAMSRQTYGKDVARGR